MTRCCTKYSRYDFQAFLFVCFFALCAFSVAGCGGGSGGAAQPQAPLSVSALLTRAQENPGFTNFSSSGTGYVTADPATGKVSGVVVTTGIFGTLAHIHSGTPGVAGPVEIPLTGGPTVWSIPEGTVLSADQMAKLKAGELYYNIHSAKFPAGEIRGQLNQQVRFAALSGVNETPVIASSATGVGVLALDPGTRRVTGFVQTAGVTGTLAHVHIGAAGVAGPVIIPLTQTSPGSGLWVVPVGATLTLSQLPSFGTGELYYNVHSAADPGGEIRGQIVSSSLSVKTALVDGTQEIPTVATGATGTGIAVVNSVTREIFGSVKTAGIAGTLAHIHDGDPGVAGPVIVPLTETPAGSGVWLVPANAALAGAPVDELDRFNANGLYFNVHSAAHPGGEIRGQIAVAGNVFSSDGGVPASAGVPAGPSPQPVVFPSAGVSFSNHVQVILSTYCSSCHSAGGVGGFLPLTLGASYANLVNVPAVKPLLPGTRVIPGDSAESVLYKRVSGVGLSDPSLRMPQGGPFLDTLNPSAIPALKAWIDEGALNN